MEAKWLCRSCGEWRAAQSRQRRGDRAGLASSAAPKEILSTWLSALGAMPLACEMLGAPLYPANPAQPPALGGRRALLSADLSAPLAAPCAVAGRRGGPPAPAAYTEPAAMP